MPYFGHFGRCLAAISYSRRSDGLKTQNPPASLSSGGGFELLTGFGLNSAAQRARRRTRNDANNSYESREFLALLQHDANLQAASDVVNGPRRIGFR
jgi:hypothetical protein